jgi:uncharacterized membrane protein YkvA (DUF1232 family)
MESQTSSEPTFPAAFPPLPTDDDAVNGGEVGDDTGDGGPRGYDRIRASVERSIELRGGAVGLLGEYLLLIPDLAVLLWRLINDRRVSGKNKILLASALVYFVLPFDLVPEEVFGPMGYIDDLILAVIALHKILGDTDPEVLREHWSGKEALLPTLRNALNAAQSLVPLNAARSLR